MQGCAVRRGTQNGGGTLSRSAIRALLFKISIKGAKMRSHGSDFLLLHFPPFVANRLIGQSCPASYAQPCTI